MRTYPAILSLFLLALPFQATGADTSNADNPAGQILYITEPACGFYRCTVTWPHGTTVAVNWIGPPAKGGNVSVSLSSNIGGPTYVITPSYPVISQPGYCDAGAGFGVVIPGVPCGAVEFVVPADWEIATNYTIVVQSLSDASAVGYTDMINITASNTTNSGPSGTVATLLTIPAPTSTDLADSSSWSGTFPADTAIVGAVVTSSSSASSNTTTKKTSSGSKTSAPTSTSSAGSSSSSSAAATTTTSKPAGAGSLSVRAGLGVMGLLVGCGLVVVL